MGKIIKRYQTYKPIYLLTNILLFCLPIILCLFIAEIGVRVFLRQQLNIELDEIYRTDDVFGWRHKKNVHTTINSGEGDITFVTDEYGYRINAEKEEEIIFNSNNEYSILFIGDSFLEGIAVENKNTIPQVVKNNIVQKMNVNISVTNSSVAGWSPNHYLIEAKHLSSKRFDLAIVFLYVANDIVSKKVGKYSPRKIGKKHLFRIPKRFTYSELINGILYPINDILEINSHLFVLIKKRTKWLRIKLGLSAYYFPEVFKIAMNSSPCWEVTAEICKSINEEFTKSNTKCIFVLLPTDIQIYDEIYDSYIKLFKIDLGLIDMEQPQRKLKLLFESLNLHLLDPIYYMREKAQEGITMYGYIDSHFNSEGHRVAAEYILPNIEKKINNKFRNE